MIIFIVLLLFLVLYQCKPRFDRGFYEDYASRNQSLAINGIFITLILLSHTFAKVNSGDVFDRVYEPMRVFLGQFVVVPFLFYSGYGIMESLSKKEGYLKTFSKNRFLKIFMQFSIITLVYIVMHLLLNSEYSWLKIVLSFTGITSIGNGGWYIFSTFFFYAMIIAWFHIFRNNKMLAAFGVAGSFVALIIVEVLLGFETYFYNTVYFFVVGMFYSFLKKPFDAFIMKNNYIWGAVTLVSLFGFCFLKQISSALYPVWCGCGMLLILCLTMKVKIGNKVLHWLGTTIFFNFTLQGIPQTIFTKYLTNNYLIYILVIVTTIVLAMGAQVLFDKKTFLPSKNV